MKKPAYCTYRSVKSCRECALVNYGRDCRNNPVEAPKKPGKPRA